MQCSPGLQVTCDCRIGSKLDNWRHEYGRGYLKARSATSKRRVAQTSELPDHSHDGHMEGGRCALAFGFRKGAPRGARESCEKACIFL